MPNLTLKIIIWSSLLLISVLEIAVSSSPEISRVQEMINHNFEKTQEKDSNSLAANRGGINRTANEPKNISEVIKPHRDESQTRNFSSYEVYEPKKHNEREVKIVYEASKSSAKVLPNEKEVKKAPYYNTSIKYSSKYSLTPEETRNINITENAVEYDEDDDYDDDDEEEEQGEQEDTKEQTLKKPVQTENVTKSPVIIKDREELTEKPGILKTREKVENIETARDENIPRRVNLASERKEVKNYLGKRNYTVKEKINPNKMLKFLTKEKEKVKPNIMAKFLRNENENEKVTEKEEVIKKPRPPIQKEKFTPKYEKRNDIFPVQGNYYITSSSRINKPQKPHREPDLKNEQSRYYWKDEENSNNEYDEDKPYKKDPTSSLKILPTEPVKILEDEIITSHPYEEPQPVSFSSIVYNNPDGESTSELSGSYYNVPNVIQERMDVEEHENEEQEDDEVSENSMEDTKSVPYTTPNYQSIQTPLNQIKFIDSYAYLNPFAKKLNNFAYEYEKPDPKPAIFNILATQPEEDAPFRASLYPNKAQLEKHRPREENQEEADHSEENTEKYRLSANELRQKERNVLRNENEQSEEVSKPTKTNYKTNSHDDDDDSSEYRPNNYKQTSDTTEQYSDNVKHYPKASLFNYNISSRHKYPYQPNSEQLLRVRNNENENEKVKPNSKQPIFNTHTKQPDEDVPYRANAYHNKANNLGNREQIYYNPNKPRVPRPYYKYNNKNETGYKPYIPPPKSYLNITKEHHQDIPVTSQNKYNYRNEESDVNSRRPQKFLHFTEEVEPKPQTIVKPVKNENIKDNSKEQTEDREPERNNYLDYSANNVFSPEVKQTFESLDENDEMYQEILSNIQSLFGTRITNLNPVAEDKASFSKPIIPVDYHSYLQPKFEENSYENLKRGESDDDEENRSEDIEDESEDIEDEEGDSGRYEDENESEEASNYDDAEDDGSEANSNVQKVRSTERYKPKPKNNKRKYPKKTTKDTPKKVENLKSQIFYGNEPIKPHRYPPLNSVEENEEEFKENHQNDEKEHIEVSTASYKNFLKHDKEKYAKENTLIRPQYGASKVIIKDVHSSPVDQKTIRVIVPKLITKDNVAIPQTHRQKLIIRKEKSLFK